jgi:hypothetical protein
MPKPTAISFRDAAKVLNLSYQRLRTKVDKGLLPTEIGPDGRRYIVREAVENTAARYRATSCERPVGLAVAGQANALRE